MVPLCKGPAPNIALSLTHTLWLAVLADVKALKRSEQRCRAELEAAGEQVYLDSLIQSQCPAARH